MTQRQLNKERKERHATRKQSYDITSSGRNKTLIDSVKLMVGWDLRTFKMRQRKPVMTIFTGLVLSTLSDLQRAHGPSD